MRGAEKLEMEIDQPCEDDVYANICDRNGRRMRNTSTAKEILAARITKHRVILILGVLLILVFITVVTLMSFLFIYCQMEQNIEGRLSNLSLGMDSRVERLSQDDYRTLKKLTAIETSIGDLKGQMEQNIEGRLSNLSLGMDSRVECLSQDDNRTLEKLTAIKTSIGDLKGSKMMEKLSTMETSMKALTGQRLEDMQQNMDVKLRNLSMGVQSLESMLSQDDSQMMKKLFALETSIKELNDSGTTEKLSAIETLMKNLKGQWLYEMEQNMELKLRNLSMEMHSVVGQQTQDGSKMMEKLSYMETSMKALTGQRLEDMQQNMDVKLRNLSMGVQSLESMLSQDDSQVMKKLIALETSIKELNGLLSKNVQTVIGAVGKQTEEIQKMTSFSSDIQRILGFLGKVAEELQKSSSNPLCSEGWRHYGLRCYYLSSDSIPWIDSKKACEDKEAHLVVINSEEEMNFLHGIANKQTFWIGLTEVDGTWRWVDGTPYDITPKFWGKGQPDDWKDHNYKTGEKGEDCAVLWDGHNWNDLHCSEKRKCICEKKMTF